MFHSRGPVHGKIYLLDKDDLVVVIPMVQNGVEGGGFDMLAHQKEFALAQDSGMTLVVQLESVTKFFEGVAIFSKDQKKVCAVLNMFVDLIKPSLDIRIDSPQF